MKINILINDTNNNPRLLPTLKKTLAFYKEREVELFLDWKDTNKGYHIILETKEALPNKLSSGSAGELGDDKKNQYRGHYPTSLVFGLDDLNGLTSGTPEVILIHEIMQCFFFEFLGKDIHNLTIPTIKDDDVQHNIANWDYFLSKKPFTNKPDKAIIHHTANQFWNYKDTRDFHIGKGWGDIGYHYFFEKDGTLKVGRWSLKEGTHCYNEKTRESQNQSSIAICLAGDFSIEKPTRHKEVRLKELLEELKFKEIAPHRKYDDTECYGKLLADDWASNLIKNKEMKKTIQQRGKKDVYLVGDDGKKRRIASYATLKDLQDAGIISNIIEMSDNLDVHPDYKMGGSTLVSYEEE